MGIKAGHEVAPSGVPQPGPLVGFASHKSSGGKVKNPRIDSMPVGTWVRDKSGAEFRVGYHKADGDGL